MAKLFDYIIPKGTLISETGILGVITGTLSFIKTNKGWMLPCTASKYITFTLPSLQQKSIITVTKVNNTYTVTQTNTTATITSLVLNNANYLRYIIYDSIASATSDKNNIQAWINRIQPLTYQQRLLEVPKPTESKISGLVGRWNSIKNGIVNDISGNGNHATAVGNMFQTVKGINTNTNGYANLTTTLNLGTSHSICWRGMLRSGTTMLLGQVVVSTNLLYISSQTVRYVSNSVTIAFNNLLPLNKLLTLCVVRNGITVSLYIDGVLNETLPVSNSNPFTEINQLFARQNLLFYNNKIEDISIYNKVLSQQEITKYHKQFKQLILHEQWKDCAVGSSTLPSGWIRKGGSFVCAEQTTNDAVIKSIRKGDKYQKCVTACILAIPCKTARNVRFEFDWYKGGDTTELYIGLTSDKLTNVDSTGTSTGYQLNIRNTEAIRLTKRLVGVGLILIETIASYITINTNYRVRIDVTATTFTTYIKGGIFGNNFTLVSTTGGSGTNPVTDTTYNTSNYFVADIDANDRIGEILIESL